MTWSWHPVDCLHGPGLLAILTRPGDSLGIPVILVPLGPESPGYSVQVGGATELTFRGFPIEKTRALAEQMLADRYPEYFREGTDAPTNTR